jgi:hypothetical protein
VRFWSKAGRFLIHTAPFQTASPYTLETYKSRIVAVETIDEALVKRWRHQARQIDDDDWADIAAAWREGGDSLAERVAPYLADLIEEIDKGIDELDRPRRKWLTPVTRKFRVAPAEKNDRKRHAYVNAFLEAVHRRSDPPEGDHDWLYEPTF